MTDVFVCGFGGVTVCVQLYVYLMSQYSSSVNTYVSNANVAVVKTEERAVRGVAVRESCHSGCPMPSC